MDEISKSGPSPNESSRAVLSRGAVSYTVQADVRVVLTFESVDEIIKSGHSNMKTLEQYFPAVLCIMLCKLTWLYLLGL